MVTTLAYALVVAGTTLGAVFLANSSDAFVSSAAAVQLVETLLRFL